MKSGFNMSFGDEAEQRTYINVCVELGRSLMEITTKLYSLLQPFRYLEFTMGQYDKWFR